MRQQVNPKNLADALSDDHLVAGWLHGATLRSDGPKGQTIERSAQSLVSMAGRLVSIASSPRWQGRGTGHFADVIDGKATDRRNGVAQKTSPIRVHPASAEARLARSLIDLCHRGHAAVHKVANEAARFFLEGSRILPDGPASAKLAGAFVAEGLRHTKGMTAALLLGTGILAVSPASAGEWKGPSTTMMDLAVAKVSLAAGPEGVGDFLAWADAMVAECVEAAGEPMDCKVEVGGVSFDFGADRYEVFDPAAPDPLRVVQKDGAMSVVDSRTGETLDMTDVKNSMRIADWMFYSDPEDELEAGVAADMAFIGLPARTHPF